MCFVTSSDSSTCYAYEIYLIKSQNQQLFFLTIYTKVLENMLLYNCKIGDMMYIKDICNKDRNGLIHLKKVWLFKVTNKKERLWYTLGNLVAAPGERESKISSRCNFVNPFFIYKYISLPIKILAFSWIFKQIFVKFFRFFFHILYIQKDKKKTLICLLFLNIKGPPKKAYLLNKSQYIFYDSIGHKWFLLSYDPRQTAKEAPINGINIKQ